MAMEKITIDRAKAIASEKGFQPGRVANTGVVQFTKGNNPRIETISWDDFESALGDRKLAVFESGGFLKIMRS